MPARQSMLLQMLPSLVMKSRSYSVAASSELSLSGAPSTSTPAFSIRLSLTPSKTRTFVNNDRGLTCSATGRNRRILAAGNAGTRRNPRTREAVGCFASFAYYLQRKVNQPAPFSPGEACTRSQSGASLRPAARSRSIRHQNAVRRAWNTLASLPLAESSTRNGFQTCW